MAFNLENMTIDYKKMLRMVPADRATLAQNGQVSDLISSLTPGQLVNLFPRYYRDQLPDIGKAVESLGGVLSDPSRYVGGGGGGGGGGGDGGGTVPYVPPELSTEKQAEILAKAGIDVTAITGAISAEGLSIDDERVKALRNLSDEEMAKSGLERVTSEDGTTIIKKVAPEALQLSDEAAIDKFSKTFPPTTFSPRERATLDFIAKREGASDPDIIFGGERYKERLGLDKKPLTEHTISEVLNGIMPKLRELSKADGYGRRGDGKIVGTSAVGTGQMIEGTLIANLRALGIPEDEWDTTKLDKNLQERLTLQNFKSSGIGDPNAPPSTWNQNRLGAQYESLNQGRGHPGMTQAEAAAIENASSEKPIIQQNVTPQEAKQKLAELETQQEQQSLTQTLFDQNQVAQSGSLGKFDQQGSNDQFGITGTASQRGLEEVDPRLVDIMRKASEEFPLRARLFSGKRDDARAHGKGLATDMEIFDESGRPLGSYKSPQTANIYAMFALKAREIQMRDYPELAGDFVWGGAFPGMVSAGESDSSGAVYGAADFMDFRIGHSSQEAMKAFKWPSENDPGGWQPGYEQYTEGDFLGIGHRTPTSEDFEKLQGFKLTQEQDNIQKQIALNGGYNAGLLSHGNIGERQPNQVATYIPSQTDNISNSVSEAQTNVQPQQPATNPVNADPVTSALSRVEGQPSEAAPVPVSPIDPVQIPPDTQQTTTTTTPSSIPAPAVTPAPPIPLANLPEVKSFLQGGSVKMPPGENMAAYNTGTGELEFVSNDKEFYTKDDQGNLRIDPSTIRQEDQKAEIAPAEPQRQEEPNQPPQRRPEQPMPVSTPDPNFLETMSYGSMASSPSQLRALNRARLYNENSGSLVNGHFS